MKILLLTRRRQLECKCFQPLNAFKYKIGVYSNFLLSNGCRLEWLWSLARTTKVQHIHSLNHNVKCRILLENLKKYIYWTCWEINKHFCNPLKKLWDGSFLYNIAELRNISSRSRAKQSAEVLIKKLYPRGFKGIQK